ncbi:MAG TPA: cyclic nucleotide-binding domain-containing protein [Chloroflexota bacterium]
MQSTQDTVASLRPVWLFRDLDDDHLRQIAESTEARESRPGDVLARRGEIGHEMVIIVDGTVRVEVDGKIITRLGPGEFFGEISLIDGKPRTATVITETPSVLLNIRDRSFDTLLDTVPGLAKKLLINLCATLRERTDMLEGDRPGLGRRVFTD